MCVDRSRSPGVLIRNLSLSPMIKVIGPNKRLRSCFGSKIEELIHSNRSLVLVIVVERM